MFIIFMYNLKKKVICFLFMFPILAMLSKGGVYNCCAAGEGLILKCEST